VILQFDDKAVRHLEVTYRSPEVTAQRRIMLDAIAAKPGEKALDIGCGPGFVTEELALAVGSEGVVEAMDNSESSLAAARQKCARFSNVHFQQADAEKLPYPDSFFDLAVSTQVYEFVPDVKKALSELRRVLRPGGRAAIIDTDWNSILWHSTNMERMNRIVKAWEEHLAHPTLPRTLNVLLREAGFSVRGCKAIPSLDTEYKPEGYSFNMTKTIARFVRDRQGITRDEAEAWSAELQELAKNGAYFFNSNRYLFIAEKI
jgi:arsenite methyltransferase